MTQCSPGSGQSPSGARAGRGGQEGGKRAPTSGGCWALGVDAREVHVAVRNAQLAGCARPALDCGCGFEHSLCRIWGRGGSALSMGSRNKTLFSPDSLKPCSHAALPSWSSYVLSPSPSKLSLFLGGRPGKLSQGQDFGNCLNTKRVVCRYMMPQRAARVPPHPPPGAQPPANEPRDRACRQPALQRPRVSEASSDPQPRAHTLAEGPTASLPQSLSQAQ